MFYTVYKITNLVNGKIYVGVHKTDDLNDGYMGSGKYLKRAQEKYGIENFKREYLHVFDNAEDMFEMESELVNEEFVARDDTYNLKVGGCGGFDYINATRNHKEHNQRLADSRNYTDPEYLKKLSDSVREGIALAKAEGRWVYVRRENFINSFLGKTHSTESKAKMSEKAKLRTGDKNSQFGMMWIMNSESGESKKIKKDDRIPDGWVKGRKIKKVIRDESD